ncbi:hypothetical protein CBS101457_005746 [Exobasidium rhododendri]|nr:hypothetical protein CBS101457_005746 [Exobasidium rhododendri]
MTQDRKMDLDAVVKGIERCLANTRERVTYHLEQHFVREGVFMTEDEKRAKVASHPSVKSWTVLLSSRIVTLSRLQLWAQSLRRPSRDDLLDSIHMLDTLNHGNVESLPAHVIGDYYNQVLTLIARLLPSVKEGAKVKKFLESGVLPHQLQLNLSADPSLNPQTGFRRMVEEMELEEQDEESHLPQTLLRIFSTVWTQMASRCKPNAASYGTALSFELKLTPWRAILPRSNNVWGPVQSLQDLIRKRGLLHVSHINQVLWYILRLGPDQFDSTEDDDQMDWPSISHCQRLYEKMRENVLQVEMEWERRMQANEGIAIPVSPLFGSSASPVGHTADGTSIPSNIVPSQRTYELLIRGYAWRRELHLALAIMHEMTQSPVDTRERLRLMEKGQVKRYKEQSEMDSPTYQATIATYDSIFRGFCKHSIPSVMVHFDPDEPDKCRWESVDADAAESNQWTIEVLVEIFESFLDLQAEACKQAEEAYLHEEGKQKTMNNKTKAEVASDEWLVEKDDAFANVWNSVLTLSDPEYVLGGSCKAPTTQQLFNILTALRRTSNDDAKWVLSQWRRIEEKFGARVDSQERRQNGKGGIVNENGWTDWKLDSRLERVLEHLKSNL